MNIDLDTIERAAKAVIETRDAMQSGAESVEDQRMRILTRMNAAHDFKVMASDYLHDPATVLELVRLARIGGCVHDLLPVRFIVPHFGKVVRGLSAMGELDEVRYEQRRFWIFDDERNDCGEGFVLATTEEPVDDITHWMPLPDAPKEQP